MRVRWPAHASWSEIAAFTLGLMVVFSLVTTFMGLLTDPLQQALGLHDRRLQRLIATLERAVRTDAAARLALPDPYLSRIADLVETQVLNRYRSGQVGFTDVVTAQATALAARRALVQAGADRQTTAVALIQALGGGWHASPT